MFLRILLAAFVAAILVACGPAPPAGTEPPAAFTETVRLAAESSGHFVAGRWDAAAQSLKEQASAASGDERLAGWRDHAFYNLACVEARAGRMPEAAAHFAESIGHGLRAPMQPGAGEAWIQAAPALTLPHILADPDLDGIRAEASYREALAQYLDAGAEDGSSVRKLPARGAPERPVTVLVLGDPEPWVSAETEAIEVRPPIAPAGHATPPGGHRWLLDDGDARWGVARVWFAIDQADTGRVHLAAEGPDASAVAWATALAQPDHVAGVFVRRGRFDRIAWADALAAAVKSHGASAWRVVLVDGDPAIEPLRAAGIQPRVVADSEFVAASLAEAVR